MFSSLSSSANRTLTFGAARDGGVAILGEETDEVSEAGRVGEVEMAGELTDLVVGDLTWPSVAMVLSMRSGEGEDLYDTNYARGTIKCSHGQQRANLPKVKRLPAGEGFVA